MPLPTPNDSHVDRTLTNISVAYLQAAENFAARQTFPVVPVQRQSDKYYLYDRGDFFRDEAAKRAPGAESAGGGYNLSTANYFCDVWAFHQDVDDQTTNNADEALNPEDDAAEFVMSKLLIRQEAEFADTYMTASVWDNDFDGTASSASSIEAIHWSDQTSGTPVEDISDAKNTVLSNTGFDPNVLVIGHDVWNALKNHPDIVDRIKYSTQTNVTPAQVNRQTLAALFEVDRIVVSKAIENTAAEDATDSFSFIIGKDALLCYAPSAPSLRTPSAGYTFSWTNYLGMTNGLGVATSRLDMRPVGRRATRVEGEIAMDMKLVSSSLGFFWDGIVS